MTSKLMLVPVPSGAFWLCENPHFWFSQNWEDLRATRDLIDRFLDEYEPQKAAPEAGREETEKALVGEPPAPDPGVQPAAPLPEPTEE